MRPIAPDALIWDRAARGAIHLTNYVANTVE